MIKLILTILVFSSFACLAAGILLSSGRKRALAARLDQLDITQRGISLEEMEMSRSFVERALLPAFAMIGHIVARYSPAGFLERTQNKLNVAGYRRADPLAYIGIKGIAALSLFGLAALVCSFSGMDVSAILVYLIIFPAAGIILPDLILLHTGNKRKYEINAGLPDLLDILTVSVEAGLGFEQALLQAANKLKGSVSKEIRRLLQDMRLGKNRSEALRAMSDRLMIPDLTTFCAAMIQADQLGVGIADVLRVQSDSMRQKRRQRAEETAMKAPLKMLFPLIFFIFPSLFVVLLGPAFISIMENLKTP